MLITLFTLLNQNQVEEWLEEQLSSKLKVDFMGLVSWFLGCHYDWHKLPDGRLTCHISQQAFTEQLLEKFGMERNATVPIGPIDQDYYQLTKYTKSTPQRIPNSIKSISLS